MELPTLWINYFENPVFCFFALERNKRSKRLVWFIGLRYSLKLCIFSAFRFQLLKIFTANSQIILLF